MIAISMVQKQIDFHRQVLFTSIQEISDTILSVLYLDQNMQEITVRSLL